jgi:hypothetical protein
VLIQARIAAEARLIRVPPALYLPTSPAWQVESILVDSGMRALFHVMLRHGGQLYSH